MIPKRIFMVWLGNAVPEYALAAVSLFRKEYPGYDIDFIRYRVSEIRSVLSGAVRSDIDRVLLGAICEIQAPASFSGYIENQKSIYGKNMKDIMLLSDIFRLELLNAFGGVYVDVDSVPGAEFDSALMERCRFCVSRDVKSGRVSDNYFMGQREGFGRWTNPMDPKSADQLADPAKSGVDFQYRRAQFVKGFPRRYSGGFYIEHYFVRSWEAMGGRAVDDLDLRMPR